MKETPIAEPKYLIELEPADDRLRVAELIRSARSSPSLSPARRQMVKGRIRNALRERRRWPLRLLRPAVVGALLFVGGGLVGASVVHRLVQAPSRLEDPSVEPQPTRPRSGGRRPATTPPVPAQHTTAERSDVPPLGPSTLPSPARDSVRELTIVPTSRLHERPPASAPVRPRAAQPRSTSAASRLHARTAESPREAVPDATLRTPAAPTERALLAEAVRRLRGAGDPPGALAALDALNAQFPDGQLMPEATVLRTEALLALGRKAEALRALEMLGELSFPRDDERRVLRAELRGAAGRWRQALQDFDAILRTDATAPGIATPLVERALWGRALARQQLGNIHGARADLHAYLRRFPSGRFAAEAARTLSSP